MPRIWCSSVRLDARLFAVAAILAATLAQSAAAAVRERFVHLVVREDGALVQRTRLEVAIEHRQDVESWSTYRVYLDQNRELTRLEAYSTAPDGHRVEVGEEDRDTLEYSGEGVLYTSRYYRLLRLRDLEPGSTVHIDQEVVFRPYYPASKILLTGDAPIERLEARVEVRGEAARRGWRYNLSGDRSGLEIEEIPGGVVVRGHHPGSGDAPPVLAPDGAGRPVLRFGWAHDGWGEEASWADVGRWYAALAGSSRSPDPALADAAATAPRDKLFALARMVEQEVRYVAVLIGVEGYRPSPPSEVLERRWGDCKDKSLLLVDLLAEAGIPAWPVLARAGAAGRVDPDFPSPEQFNHVLVAAAADAVGAQPGDVVVEAADGERYLLLDPTQHGGIGRWLHPALQDQLVLIVRPERYPLAVTPLDPAGEARRLDVRVTIDPAGDAHGEADLTLRGEFADSFLRRSTQAEARHTDGRRLLQGLLPGALLGAVAAREGEAYPTLHIHAELDIPGLARGAPDRPTLLLPGMRIAPEPHLLDGRELEIIVPARSAQVVWEFELPAAWCPPEPFDERLENPLGRFISTLHREDDGRWIAAREALLSRRRIGPESFAALRELAEAEHRGYRRRIRLACP